MLELTFSEQHQVAIPEEILESLNLKVGNQWGRLILGKFQIKLLVWKAIHSTYNLSLTNQSSPIDSDCPKIYSGDNSKKPRSTGLESVWVDTKN